MKVIYKRKRTMKAMYLSVLTVAAFVFLFPLSARSEIKQGSVEVEPFVGFNFFENRQNLNNQLVYGGRLGYNFTRYFGLEGVAEFINTSVNDKGITGAVKGQFRSPMNSVNLMFYHLDAVYTFIPDGTFNPFILVGFGGANYDPSISDQDMGALNVGVGAKYWLTDHIALRLDIYDYIVSEFFMKTYYNEDTYNNIGATLGVTFAFGGKEKPAQKQLATTGEGGLTNAEYRAEPVVIPLTEPKAQKEITVIAAEPKKAVVVLALEDIHFDFDSSALTTEAKEILKEDIKRLKGNPQAKIRIAGYTSASGTKVYNQNLGERRAKAVEDYLVQEGLVAQDMLTTISYGKSRPAEYEAVPSELYSKAAKANMRVLFEIDVE